MSLGQAASEIRNTGRSNTFTLVETSKLGAFTMQAYRDLIGHDGPIDRADLFVIVGQVQDAFECVPRVVVEDLAKRSGVPVAHIWGALTAYRDFNVVDGQ